MHAPGKNNPVESISLTMTVTSEVDSEARSTVESFIPEDNREKKRDDEERPKGMEDIESAFKKFTVKENEGITARRSEDARKQMDSVNYTEQEDVWATDKETGEVGPKTGKEDSIDTTDDMSVEDGDSEDDETVASIEKEKKTANVQAYIVQTLTEQKQNENCNRNHDVQYEMSDLSEETEAEYSQATASKLKTFFKLFYGEETDAANEECEDSDRENCIEHVDEGSTVQQAVSSLVEAKEIAEELYHEVLSRNENTDSNTDSSDEETDAPYEANEPDVKGALATPVEEESREDLMQRYRQAVINTLHAEMHAVQMLKDMDINKVLMK